MAVAVRCSVGFKFLPTDRELVGYYLFNKIFIKSESFNDAEQVLVKECDLYGSQEPWQIWELYGGDYLEESQALHLFTRRKKASVNGSRISRKVGSGTWAGEDCGEKIVAGNVVGCKKRFRYENQDSPHNGAWIMHELAIDSKALGLHDQDIVVCRLKKNLFVGHKKRVQPGNSEPSTSLASDHLSHTT
ncbi:hypothetical protein Ddye_026269 [Dipteronia dyeriana]|uniref:NAC domain-containing protein n=1 Tax=Dipteronia dyeriana TaxID=168575 RepID=A0AAD9WP10_9ROSI|nr:hypothetical protein Ddye_026269 [Dipteronia dyeriana]